MIIKPKISLGATVFFNSSSADCKLTSCFQVLQQRAPVKSVVYDTPFSRMTPFYINMLVELYRTDLECYAHKRLPRLASRPTYINVDSQMDIKPEPSMNLNSTHELELTFKIYKK